jgi:hypothetical protein
VTRRLSMEMEPQGCLSEVAGFCHCEERRGRLADVTNPEMLPCDARRMIYGGFESLVKA